MKIERIQHDSLNLKLFLAMLGFVGAFIAVIAYHNKSGTLLATLPTAEPIQEQNLVQQYGVAKVTEALQNLLKKNGLPLVKMDGVATLVTRYPSFRLSEKTSLYLDLIIKESGFTAAEKSNPKVGAQVYAIRRVSDQQIVWQKSKKSTFTNRGAKAGQPDIGVTINGLIDGSKYKKSEYRIHVGRPVLPAGEYYLSAAFDRHVWTSPISEIQLLVRKDVPPEPSMKLILSLLGPALVLLLILISRAKKSPKKTISKGLN